MKIWVAVGKSESSDDYYWGCWDHKPTRKEVKKGFDFDEEWPHISWWLVELEAL